MPRPQKNITIALIGNPNCGKTSLFNALTGARQRVGNWPGVTVERISGNFTHEGFKVEVVDLPGIYSLTAYSQDERIARDFLLLGKPDLIVNIVDAANLERNLYLTTQLLELDLPLVLALNQVDAAKQNHINISTEILSSHLHLPVIPTVATKKEGIFELKSAITQAVGEKPAKKPDQVSFGLEGDRTLLALKNRLQELSAQKQVGAHWMAVKFLEQDEDVIHWIGAAQLLHEVNQDKAHLENFLGEDAESHVANCRYGFIAGLTKEAVKKRSKLRLTISDKIDSVVTNRILGIPIFALIMLMLFKVSIDFSQPGIAFIEHVFLHLTVFLKGLFSAWGLSKFLSLILIDGIVAGIGAVLSFTAPIGLVFLFLALLEDSGYLSRAAFVMDKLMHSIGLPGKAFIPLLLGFGCNVPGIMATRTLENENDRILSVLINPFMSCGARLPVYLMLAGAIFSPQHSGLVVFSLYFIGIFMAIAFGFLLKKTLLKGIPVPFVMELPPYRMPTLKSLFLHTGERVLSFIKKAGTIILIIIILLVVLGSLPLGVKPNSSDSLLGIAGKTISPVFKPLGFSNWKAAVGIITGIMAKEAVVGTMGALYGIDEGNNKDSSATLLKSELARDFTPLSAYCFLLFILLYAPCASAIGAIMRETGLKWTVFSVVGQTSLAYLVSFLVFNVGSLLLKL